MAQIIVVSAFQFDNVKDYNNENRQYVLTNAFGLGGTISEIKMNTPHINNIGIGYQMVSEMEVVNGEWDWIDIINKIEVYNIKDNMKKIDRNIDIKYKLITQIDVPKRCDMNITKDCGTTKENKIEWLPFEKNSLKVGEKVTLGFFTNTKEGDYIEWIPTMYGNQKLNNYDIWNASINNGLVSYFKLDETTGAIANDEVKIENGVLKNMENGDWIAGKINNGLNFSGVDEYFNTTTSDVGVNGEDFSMSLWYKPDVVTGYQALVSNMESQDLEGRFYIRKAITTNLLTYLRRDTNIGGSTKTVTSTTAVSVGSWYHIVVTYNEASGNMQIWVNNVLEDETETGDAAVFSGTYDYGLMFGGALDSGGNFAYPLQGTEDEIGIWNRTLSIGDIAQLYNSGSGLNYSTTSIPSSISVTLDAPINNYGTADTSITFDSRASCTNCNITNATLKTWTTSGVLYKTNYTEVNGTSNYTNLSISFATALNYSWNVNYCATNDTGFFNCSYAASNRTLNILSATENSFSYNTTSLETAKEGFILELGTGGNIITSASLNYGGVSYSGVTITNSTSNNYTLTKTIDVSSSGGNKTWYFDYITNSTSFSSTTKDQYVNTTFFVNCNSTINKPYLNITFKDEVSLLNINGSIPSSTFVYYLGTGTTNKTYSFSNNSVDNPSYGLCVSPSDRTLNFNSYIQYKYGTTYPQRIWNSPFVAYTNSTTSKTLYLLSSSDGIYVTFNVLDSAGNSLDGVSVNGTRVIDSVTELVADGTTDDSGAVTFWLNPDYAHIFTFSKSGYTTFTTTITPTQSSYTVTFGQTVTTSSTDYSKGITEILQPFNEFLDNNTIYNFNYTINSSYWTLDSFGMVLKYSNKSIIGINSSTNGVGGTVSLFANTLNFTGMIMDYYYIINGTITNRTSRYWGIETTEGREFSIYHFFTDLNSYINANMFGILGDSGDDWFGKSLIAFVVIVLVTGGLSYRYGITNEVSILGVLFGVILLLNTIPIKLLDTPSFIESIDMGNLLLVVTGLIFAGFIIKEEWR
jgi:hypothetical protein